MGPFRGTNCSTLTPRTPCPGLVITHIAAAGFVGHERFVRCDQALYTTTSTCPTWLSARLRVVSTLFSPRSLERSLAPVGSTNRCRLYSSIRSYYSQQQHRGLSGSVAFYVICEWCPNVCRYGVAIISICPPCLKCCNRRMTYCKQRLRCQN